MQAESGLFAPGAGGYRPSAEYTRALTDSKVPAPELEVTALLNEAMINPEETYTLSFDNACRSNHGPPSPCRISSLGDNFEGPSILQPKRLWFEDSDADGSFDHFQLIASKMQSTVLASPDYTKD